MKKAVIFLIATAAINVIVRIISRNSPSFSEFYARVFYPVLAAIAAAITGFFPFAVVELLLYILILAVISGIAVLTIRLVKNKQKRVRTLLAALLTVACTLSSVMIMFLFGCEINYHRRTLPELTGMTVEQYSLEDLRRVVDEVTAELAELVPQIQTGGQGQFVMDRSKFRSVSRTAMQNLSQLHPAPYILYPRPKPVILSELLFSRTRTCGMYSPFTFEALYNRDMPDSEIPFTVTHELSHLSGFMREDEANFLAFLACRDSGDVDFMYSGYVNALVYLINAYYAEAEAEEYREALSAIPEQVQTEFYYISEYWKPYRDTAVSNAARTLNDTYLKANKQTDGVKSYGRLVDLLLAEYAGRKSDF